MDMITLAMAKNYTDSQGLAHSTKIDCPGEDIDYVSYMAGTDGNAYGMQHMLGATLVQSIITECSAGNDVTLHFLTNAKDVYAKVISCRDGFVMCSFCEQVDTANLICYTIMLSSTMVYAKAEKWASELM